MKMKWNAGRIGSAVAAVVALAGVAAVASIGPRNVIGMLRYDQRQEGTLRVGDRAPDVALWQVAGDAQQSLSAHVGGQPLVVIFDSFT